MAFKYLVYDNPQGTTLDFVRDTDGNPRIYEDLDLAEDCANDQTNGYVVPLGLDILDMVRRIQTLGEASNALMGGESQPSEGVINKLIEDSQELAKDMCDVVQQPYMIED